MREFEAAEANGIAPEAGADMEAWWRHLLARDRPGYLRRAREAALGARTLAVTPSEAARVTELLALIECESGCHREEPREARARAALKPRDGRALSVLRRAAICNGQPSLARETNRRMETATGQDLHATVSEATAGPKVVSPPPIPPVTRRFCGSQRGIRYL